jgi:hypothetical protein
MQVYVLLFNARTDNEGIHTLKRGDRNTVLMFEDEDDATRFGLLLEAQDFPNPSVEAIDEREIEDFCEGAGYDFELVRKGSLAVPPETNVEDPDWQSDTKPEPISEEVKESELSDPELDRLRRQFENLL